MRMFTRSHRLTCAGALCAFACLLVLCAAARSQQTVEDAVVQGGVPTPMTLDKVMFYPDTGDDTGGFLWWAAPSGWSFYRVSSLNLIANAYGLGARQVIGLPRWAETDRYDLTATMDADRFEAFKKLPMDKQLRERLLMTQAVLADRYQLRAHRETREMPVYELVAAGGGLKIAETDRLDPVDSGSSFFMPGEWYNYGTMEDLASNLAGPSGGIVIDKTGMGSRRFHYALKWLSDGRSGTAGGASIFTAIEEELGLKLVPATEPVEVLVIDHIERPTPAYPVQGDVKLATSQPVTRFSTIKR